LKRRSGGIAARSGQALDKAGADRIGRHRKHDWDDRCCLLNGTNCASRRDDDIDLEPHELGREVGVAVVAPFRPAILDRNSATLDPTELA
jgi:hypothetical protein